MLPRAAAFACQQRGRDRLRRGQCCGLVRDHGADHARPAGVAVGLDVGDPGQGLDHRIVDALVRERPGFAEAADRDVDNLRVQGADNVRTEAHRVDRAGAKILHEHIRRARELFHDLNRARLLQIERDRALAAVHVEKSGAHAVAANPHLARDIATGRFDLDDIRALVGEQHRSHRAREHARQVEDAKAGQWTVHRAHYNANARPRPRQLNAARYTRFVMSASRSATVPVRFQYSCAAMRG